MFPEFLTIAITSANFKLTPWTLQINGNETRYIRDAPVLTILSQVLNFNYKFVEPTDGLLGEPSDDGNFSGMIGMLQREEVDIAFGKISITESRASAVDFSFPYQYIPVTFITDKPRAFPDKYAIMHPFEFSVWIALAISLMLIQLISYAFFKIKNYSFQIILLKFYGSLLEKSLDIKSRKLSLKTLILSWILGAMLVSFAYKAVFFSFLIFPTLSGIRNIRELSRATEDSSFRCSTYVGTKVYAEILRSGGETWNTIAKCLSRNDMHTDDVEAFLQQFPAQEKAFIGQKQHLMSVSKGYFITDDFFFISSVGFAVRKSFRYKDVLDKHIIRMGSAGILSKFERDEEFFMSLGKGKNYAEEQNRNRQLSLEDFEGAFIILGFGHILASVALILEILYSHRNKK